MANAAAKKTAAHNEKALQNLNRGMVASTLLSILLRWWRGRGIFNLGFSFACVTMVVSYITGTMAYTFLANAGKSSQDAAGNTRAPSVDLSNPGMICEWIFDILYITWVCQVGSALLGEFVWWLYLVIPAYAAFRIGPMAYGFLKPSSSIPDEQPRDELTSKRQQKLKARQERGDSRVKSVSVRRGWAN